jgi:hypothetical protein
MPPNDAEGRKEATGGWAVRGFVETTRQQSPLGCEGNSHVFIGKATVAKEQCLAGQIQNLEVKPRTKLQPTHRLLASTSACRKLHR